MTVPRVHLRTIALLLLSGLFLVPARGGVDEEAINSPSLQQFQGDGRTFVLVDPLQYRIKATGRVITVPPGFVTDFASVPRLAQSVISVLGQHSVPAVVHDYLYWEQKCTRLEADDIFYTAMEEYKSSWFQKTVAYRAVRIGGGSAWSQNTEDRKQGLPRVIPLVNNALPPNAVWTTYRKELFDSGVRAEPILAEPPPRPAYCVLSN